MFRQFVRVRFFASARVPKTRASSRRSAAHVEAAVPLKSATFNKILIANRGEIAVRLWIHNFYVNMIGYIKHPITHVT